MNLTGNKLRISNTGNFIEDYNGNNNEGKKRVRMIAISKIMIDKDDAYYGKLWKTRNL